MEIRENERLREAWNGEDEFLPYLLMVNSAVRNVPPHWHDDLELVVVSRGKVRLEAAGRGVDLEAGDFTLLKPGTVHLFTGDGSGDCLVVKLRRNCFRSELGTESGMSWLFTVFDEKRGPVRVSGRDELIFSMVSEMMSAYREKNNGWQLTVKGNFYRLVGRLAAMRLIAPPVEISRHDRERVERLFSALDTSYMEEWSEGRAADFLGLSYWYFSRFFKRVTGTSFLRVLNRVRIREARKLLTESDMPVGEVAFRTGFSSHDHFLRSFKREVGLSPSRFRKELAGIERTKNGEQ